MPPKSQDFSLPKRLVKDYESAIHQIIRRVLKPKLPGQSFNDWLAELAARSKEKDILEASDWLARRMIFKVNESNAKTWRQAAAKHSQSRRLYTLLQREMKGATGARVSALVRENAAYISSLPLIQAQVLVGEIQRAEAMGARPETIAKMAAARFPKLLKSRVNLIARTETQKTSTALTRARSEDVGAQFYIWETSRDGDRVRLSHRNMQGVVVPWSDPPDPEALVHEKSTLGHYAVGCAPNCRCTPVVVLTLDDISFPARVYHTGGIHQMTKRQFKQRFADLEEIAA